MGGLAVAATLRRAGFEVQVYEQAHRFARVGAGIAYEGFHPDVRAVLEACPDCDLAGAFTRDEAHRKPRTSRIQAISSANTGMKGGNEDTSWLYGYDAWNVPLTAGLPQTRADGAFR